MKKQVDIREGSEVVFNDYPIGRYAKKVDWWTSEEGIKLIRGWRQCGASFTDIAKQCGVDVRTFRAWRKKCPELEEALVFGKEVTNARVVDALYRRATGFHYDEVTRELVEGEMRVTKIVTKYCPPDTKAILSWLYNRYPDLWRAIQTPVDENRPALLAADGVLVRIREATEGASEATGATLSGGDVYQPGQTAAANGEAGS